MKFIVTRRFRRAYAGLGFDDAEQTRKALILMNENLGHPGLHVKKIKGTDHIWEARAGLSIRITVEIKDDTILLRNVGRHDKTLKRP